MNIGYFTEMMNIGGASALVLRETRWLQEHGHRAMVASAGGPLVADLAAAQIPHVLVPSFEAGKPLVVEQLVADGAALWRAMDEFSLDAVIAQAQLPFPFGVAASGGTMPVFLDLLSPVYWVPKTQAGIKAVREAALDGRIIAGASGAARAFAAAYQFDPQLPHVINVSIQAPQPLRSTRDRMRAEFGIHPGETLIVTVSRLDPDRTPMVLPLARAAAKLAPQYRTRLLVVGDGSDLAALKAKAPAGTVFAGFRRDLPDIYNASDLFVGEGSVVQDAAAAGLPAIITCATEYRDRGDSAFSIFGMHIVDHFFTYPTNLAAPVPMVDALSLLLSNPGLTGRLRTSGKELVNAHWHIDRVMEKRLHAIANRHTPGERVGSAQAIVEIEGGMNADVEVLAAALASIDAKRFGVRARSAVPWQRYAAMPLEHVQALCAAGWRATFPAPLTYTLNGAALAGPVSAGHEDLREALRAASAIRA